MLYVLHVIAPLIALDPSLSSASVQSAAMPRHAQSWTNTFCHVHDPPAPALCQTRPATFRIDPDMGRASFKGRTSPIAARARRDWLSSSWLGVASQHERSSSSADTHFGGKETSESYRCAHPTCGTCPLRCDAWHRSRDACDVVGHNVLDACAHAQGAGARSDTLQAVQGIRRARVTCSRSAAEGGGSARFRQNRRWRIGWRTCYHWRMAGEGMKRRAQQSARTCPMHRPRGSSDACISAAQSNG